MIIRGIKEFTHKLFYPNIRYFADVGPLSVIIGPNGRTLKSYYGCTKGSTLAILSGEEIIFYKRKGKI